MGEKFHGSLDFIIIQGKHYSFTYDKNENMYIGTQNGFL